MSTCIPFLRGISAVALAVLAGFVLPKLASPHGGPMPRQLVAASSLLLLSTVVASGIALFSKARADKMLGGLAGVLTLWLIYASLR